jgi:hypothetical protein
LEGAFAKPLGVEGGAPRAKPVEGALPAPIIDPKDTMTPEERLLKIMDNDGEPIPEEEGPRLSRPGLKELFDKAGGLFKNKFNSFWSKSKLCRPRKPASNGKSIVNL